MHWDHLIPNRNFK